MRIEIVPRIHEQTFLQGKDKIGFGLVERRSDVEFGFVLSSAIFRDKLELIVEPGQIDIRIEAIERIEKEARLPGGQDAIRNRPDAGAESAAVEMLCLFQ